jgi:hypothetical protein
VQEPGLGESILGNDVLLRIDMKFNSSSHVKLQQLSYSPYSLSLSHNESPLYFSFPLVLMMISLQVGLAMKPSTLDAVPLPPPLLPNLDPCGEETI